MNEFNAINQAELLLNGYVQALQIESTSSKFKSITSGSVAYTEWNWTFTYSTTPELEAELERSKVLFEAVVGDSVYSWKVRKNLTLKMIDSMTINGKFNDDSFSDDKGGYTRRPLAVLQNYVDWCEKKIKEESAILNPNIGIIIGGINGTW